MQFKNIIFSAALLAMVSAAPIDNVPNTDAVHKDATGAATDSTAAAPPTKDVAVPEFNVSIFIISVQSKSNKGLNNNHFFSTKTAPTPTTN